MEPGGQKRRRHGSARKCARSAQLDAPERLHRIGNRAGAQTDIDAELGHHYVMEGRAREHLVVFT
jgi:hypothetical protein